MKLWQVTRNNQGGYDTYSDFIVAAETEDDARKTHPDGDRWNGKKWISAAGHEWNDSSWTEPDNVTVKEIGTAAEGIEGVQCASFHTG